MGALAFSADGSLLASGGWRGSLRLWDPVGGHLLQVSKASTSGLSALAFSSAGDLLVGGTEAGEILLWAPPTAVEARLLQTLEFPITSLAFSEDGSRLRVGRQKSPGQPTSAGHRGGEVWSGELSTKAPLSPGTIEAARGLEVESFASEPGPFGSLGAEEEAVYLAWTDREGKRWALSSEGNLWRTSSLDAQGEPELAVVPQGLGPVAAAAVQADGKAIAGGGMDGILRLRALDPLGPVRLLGAPVLSVTASADGRLVAASHGSGILGHGRVDLWERHSLWPQAGLSQNHDGELVASLAIPGRVATCLSFQSENGLLELWAPRRPFGSWDWRSSKGLGGIPTDLGPDCPRPHDRRFYIQVLRQVEDKETALTDGRSGLLIELSRSFLVATDIPHRTFWQRLRGAFSLVGIDTEGALVIAEAHPRWPLSLLLTLTFGWLPLLRFGQHARRALGSG